ncbi:DUF748 domain-containing protein [Rhodohalobacter sp. 614A]|uniref:DUF748 domain-containing protein n=1 Tax=Rhodohalobacter sp. 614A TaxID=2908649 RepID=UPI001F167339|nr:hypothetical protein [Rhodohalobacter sp. 614A]
MKHKGLKIFGGLLVVLIAAFIILNFSLDGIVKSAIEENGTELLQTEVNIGNVNVSLFDGSGVIYGFTVANPEGFSDEKAIVIDEMSLKIDLATIFSDTIVVENIHIQNPELFFEQIGLGINLRKLNENMDVAEDTEGPSMVINHLLMEDGTVRVSSTIERERTAEASIEEFELTNIGQSGSNTMKQSIREIMDPLIERAIQEAVSRGLLEQLENKVQDLLGVDDDEE